MLDQGTKFVYWLLGNTARCPTAVGSRELTVIASVVAKSPSPGEGRGSCLLIAESTYFTPCTTFVGGRIDFDFIMMPH